MHRCSGVSRKDHREVVWRGSQFQPRVSSTTTIINKRYFMPPVGLEPTTYWLKASYSAN